MNNQSATRIEISDFSDSSNTRENRQNTHNIFNANKTNNFNTYNININNNNDDKSERNQTDELIRNFNAIIPNLILPSSYDEYEQISPTTKIKGSKSAHNLYERRSQSSPIHNRRHSIDNDRKFENHENSLNVVDHVGDLIYFLV